MNNHEINNDRRRFLILATNGAGGAAALGVATPSVASFFPSEKAKVAGAAVETDVSKIESGQMMTAEWQGKPIWVVNHTAQQLKDLKALDGVVSDSKPEVKQQPENCRNGTRSIKPNIFVAIGICTHLGCSPTYRPDAAPVDLGSTWKDDLSCSCHDSKSNMAGRVYKDIPTPINLVVPPYKHPSDATVLVDEA